MNKKFTLIGSIALSLSLLGGAVSAQLAHNDVKEADAATTYTYSLRGDREESGWSTDFASCEDTGSGGSFTIELVEGEIFKIVITASGDSSWSYWPTYAETLSHNYSAWFSADGENCVVTVGGEYTFTFAAGWATYGEKWYGLTLTCPEISTLTMTYSTIVGDNGDYIYGTKDQSVMVGSTTLTYADFVPADIYGLTFNGFYSDAACTTSIALTTEVKENVTGVYAKYDYSDGAVEYVVDYSAATSTVFNSDYLLSINFWKDGGALTWPGIMLGRVDNGLATVTLPSDAIGMQLVSNYTTGGQAGHTGDVAVVPSTDTVHHIFLVDGGTADTYGYYNATAYLADEGYMTIYNALEDIADQCGTSSTGTSVTAEITNAWTSMTDVTTSYMSHISGITANQKLNGLAGLVSVYDYCVSKYGLDNVLSRSVTSEVVRNTNSSDDSATQAMIIIGSALAGSLVMMGGYFLLRKKRKSHKA